jgi:hypothetical protein
MPVDFVQYGFDQSSMLDLVLVNDVGGLTNFTPDSVEFTPVGVLAKKVDESPTGDVETTWFVPWTNLRVAKQVVGNTISPPAG